MPELCGNTIAEIRRDQVVMLNREEWEIRQEERELKLQRRREFIKSLLTNSAYIHGYCAWTLSDAIANITSSEFWNHQPTAAPDTLSEYFNEDPELVSVMFASGDLNQFKSLVQYEVEKLADMLDGKL